MADITVSYKGTTIAEVSASGTTTLGTSGKYCEDDITLQYVKSGGVTPTNMITNGDFSAVGATTDGWASIRPNYASIAISGGKLVLTHTATSNGAFGVRLSDINTTAGHTYYFRYKFTKTMNDSDADSKVIDIKLGSDVAECIRGLTQNDVVENVAAYVAQSNETTLDIDFGGNIATTASNESMLELWYIEMYDITDIVNEWAS